MVSAADPRLEIVREIRNIVERWNAQSSVKIPPLVHIAVGLQESNLTVNNTGDNGQSPGIFQIYQPAHPATDQLAINPYADYAYFIIRQPWEAAWLAVDGDTYWQNIPNRPALLEAFAPKAQGSIAWPVGTGAQRYYAAVALWEQAS